MKKCILAITVLYLINNANTCIGQEGLTGRSFSEVLSQFTPSPEGNVAAAAASIVTEFLPYVTKLTGEDPEASEKVLRAKVTFGEEWLKGPEHRSAPTRTLLKALQDNEKARNPDKSNSPDFLAQVELFSFTFHNSSKYPNNISPLFEATPSNLFLVKYFPLLAVLIDPNNKYFNEARKTTGNQIGTIGDEIVKLTASRASGNSSQKDFDRLVSQIKNLEAQITLFTYSIKKSKFNDENKKFLVSCLEKLHKKFLEKIPLKNEEPDAKRQRTQ